MAQGQTVGELGVNAVSLDSVLHDITSELDSLPAPSLQQASNARFDLSSAGLGAQSEQDTPLPGKAARAVSGSSALAGVLGFLVYLLKMIFFS